MTAISMAGNIHKLLSFMTERNITMKNTMKKLASLLLVIAALLALSACGSKDAVAGTWTGDLGADGVVTWTFDGKGGCTMENPAMKQKGTYSLEGDQMTVQLENGGKETELCKLCRSTNAPAVAARLPLTARFRK